MSEDPTSKATGKPTGELPGDPGEDPIARALGYPYPRHPGPVLFDPGSGAHAAHVVDIGPERGHVVAGLRVPVPSRAIAITTEHQTIEIEDAVVLIAAGSNGSTVQLARKYHGRHSARPILIAPATVSGAVSVYSAHIASYGSVPATMYPAGHPTGHPVGHRAGDRTGDARAALHVLMMPAEELAHINATESLGVNYVLAAPHGVSAIVEGVTIARPLAYVSKRGAAAPDASPVLLAQTGGAATGYPALSQPEMLERVRAYVGHAAALRDFVARLSGDRAARMAVTERLAATALRWDLADDEIVADGR